jgi:hypothetical protein
MYSRSLRLVILCLTASFAMWAQTQGTIQGVVSDNSGAVIPGAAVSVTNNATGVTINAFTNEAGFYLVPSLNAGMYKVTATSDGFAPQERPQVRVEVGLVNRVNFALNVGNVVEIIEVSASSQLLQTEQTDVGQVIDSKRILEMPLNGRNYLQLAQFTTGVLPSRTMGKGTRQDGERGGEGGFRAMGINVAQNNILLDGMDNSSRNSGGALGFQAQAVKPPVDAVSEFKVVTNNMSAEYGYRAGAKVLVTTKSGSNQFHGSVYEFLRNDALDGANFFANRVGAPKPTYRQNQYGGTIGGPIIKNRTFFFFSYQGTKIRLGQSFTSSVPSLQALAGDFSEQPAVRRNIFDPLTLSGTGDGAFRTQFPNNRIPSTRFDPVSMRIAALYPAPNIAGRDHLPNNFFFSPSDSDDAHQYDMRFDHNFSDKHRFFARYSLRDQFINQNGPLPVPAIGGTGQTVDLLGHNWAFNLSSALKPSVFNELRVGYTYFPTTFDIPIQENLNPQFGIQGAFGDTLNDGKDNGFTLFNVAGFASVGPRGFWPNFNDLNNFMLSDSLSIIRGNHTIKFGGEVRRTQIFREAQRHRRGNFSFSSDYTTQFPNEGPSRANTGNGLADMMLGWASGGNTGSPQGETTVVPYYGFFIQDDWKVTPKLTMNIGLRYEMMQNPIFPDPANQTVSRYLLSMINDVSPDQEGFVFPRNGRDCGCRQDRSNFAPRLGLAYRLNDKTVIRSGAGIYYGEPDNPQSESARFTTGPPLAGEINLGNFTNFETTPLFVQSGFPPFQTGEIVPGLGISPAYDYQPTFYVGQWFFDLQRTLPGDIILTGAYIGTSSSHMWTGRNLNTPLTPHPTINVAQRRPWQQWGGIGVQEAMLNANFNSMTVKAEKRFTKGLTFLSSFTWSKNINFGNENLEQGGAGRAFQHDLSLERGRANLDRRLVYVANAVYELPFGKGRQYLQSGPGSWFLGGWQLGGIVSLMSGVPQDHTINVQSTNVGGAQRGDVVASPHLPRSERSIDRWFNTSFVTRSAPGVFGNAGRNVVEGPGRRNIDVMVARNFMMPWEGHTLQFRFESFNFTNTPAFGQPNTAVGTPNVGLINEADEPRRIQFALKYVF